MCFRLSGTTCHRDRLKRWLDFSKRPKACVEAGGGHFEHSQWQWNSDIWSTVDCDVQTMLLNWCCSLNIFNARKMVGGHIKKSISSLFINRITFHLAIRCKTFKQINLQNFKLKFPAIAEKAAKHFRGLLYFAAPCTKRSTSLVLVFMEPHGYSVKRHSQYVPKT